jgi:hypothetical protein
VATVTPPAARDATVTPPVATETPESDPFASPDFSKRVAPGSNPLELEKIASNLAGTDPELSQKYRVDARKLRADIAASGKILGIENVMIDVPGWADADTRQKNVESNRKTSADMANADTQRKIGRESLDTMRKTLQTYQSGSLNDIKAEISAFSEALGGPKLTSADMNPEAYQIIVKEGLKNVFSAVKEAGGRPLVLEITALTNAVANATLAPEANRKILSQAIGILDFTDKFYKDWQGAYDKNPALSPSKFQADWIEKNPLSAFTDKAYAETPVRGATPKSFKADGKVGAQYIVEPGFAPGITKPTKVRYLGVNKDTGNPDFQKAD